MNAARFFKHPIQFGVIRCPEFQVYIYIRVVKSKRVDPNGKGGLKPKKKNLITMAISNCDINQIQGN